MTSRDDNPRWLAALVAALPVLLGVLWAWSAPHAARPGHREPQTAPVVVRTAVADPERLARAP